MEENFKWLNKCVGFNGSGGDYIYISNRERMLQFWEWISSLKITLYI